MRVVNVEKERPPSKRFAFLTLPNYTALALTSAIEVLRMANRVLKWEAYQWTIISEDGQSVAASNGLSVGPTHPVADMGAPDIVFVCSGVNIRRNMTASVLGTLRQLAQRRIPLGALCTGGYVLAKAGLLDNRCAVVHWEDMPALREEFPRIDFLEKLYCIDRDRYTASGGTAPIDMMLHLIREQHGADTVTEICDQFVIDRLRDERDRQRVPLQAQVGAYHQHLLRAAELMEANIEEPLSLDDVADMVGVSRRQIERLFKRHLGMVPSRYYLEARLRRARMLLVQTNLSIMEIAVACGFESPPHFSRCYRSQFGCTPSAERNRKEAFDAIPHVVPPIPLSGIGGLGGFAMSASA